MLLHRSTRSGQRYPLLILLVGLPLAALVPLQTEKFEALWLALSNAGHLPLFGLFASGIFFALPHRLARRPGRYIATLAISYLAIILIEVVQPLFNRTTSLEDALTGMLGVALALGGIYLWKRQPPSSGVSPMPG